MVGKTVLITGASGGIGSAAAIKFAREGHKVAIHYFSNQSKAEALERKILEEGYCAKAFVADLTSSHSVNLLFSEIETHFGAVEILINAAGYSDFALCHEITDESWQKTMAINLDASFYCCRRAIPNMLSKHEGVILNVSSIWGISGASMEVHYSTAKAAIIGMTKAMAKELGPSNICVNCLAPGWIETEMNVEHDEDAVTSFLAETPLGRVGSPEEIAEWMLFLCSKQASFMTGQIISPNGGVVI